jgi:nucleotide-binding universal stress UspA family protein
MVLMNAVLVATDFGETSTAALVYGRTLARTFGARLHVLHVADAISELPGEEFYPGELEALRADAIERATRQLDHMLASHDLTATQAKPVVSVSGNAAGPSVDYAKEAHVDVIVLGTHGRGPISHLFMGSVAEHVVRRAPCPVLVVRPNEHEFVVPDPLHVRARI